MRAGLLTRVARLERAVATERRCRAVDPGAAASPPPPLTDTAAFARAYRAFRLPAPAFHRAWYAAMDDPALRRVFILGPRGHAKTTTILTHALFALCADHQLRVGIVSETDRLARGFLAELRHELEANRPLIARFARALDPRGRPTFVGVPWNAHELLLADARQGPRGLQGKDVSVFAVGRGGQVAGRHCDLLLVDDLESTASTASAAMRARTRAWWSREIEPVLAPGGRVLATGTRKHFDDLYSYWLAPGSGWHVVDVAQRVFQPDGQPIWPEMWSLADLAARKAQMDAQDPLVWPQEFLNEPRPSETVLFDPERWPVCGSVPHGLTILQFWDLAISQRTEADYTVGVTIGVDTLNTVYVLDLRRGHWDFNRTLAEIEAMGHLWPEVQAIGIEQVAYQAAAVQEALRRTLLPIVPVERTGADRDKVTRATLLAARAAAGKVLRPADAPWWPALADELRTFPAGAHDDQVDALASAVKLAGSGAASIA